MLSPACSYFVQYWNRLTSGRQGGVHTLHKAFNARVVIRELLDEIEFNDLKNRENKDFFQSLINDYVKSDRAVRRRLRPSLIDIAQEIQHYKRRPLYLRQLCRRALVMCDTLQFFDDNVEEVVEIVRDGKLTDDVKRDISVIANNLIVELIAIGYTEADLSEIMNSCFSIVQRDEHGVRWGVPHDVKYPSPADAESLDQYEAKLKEIESSLGEEGRIRKIGWFARKKMEEYSYIFRCYGMRSKSGNGFEVGGVSFYSTRKKRYSAQNEESGLVDEAFGDPDGEILNAHVTVCAISSKSAEILARTEVEEAISVATLVAGGRNRVSLSGSHICLQAGRVSGASYHAFDAPGSNWLDDMQIDRLGIDMSIGVEGMVGLKNVAERVGWIKRLNEAIFWIRRARESGTFAERFLDFWIAIETLCAKSSGSVNNWFETKEGEVENAITIIREVCSRMQAVARMRGDCHSLYRRVKNSWGFNNPKEISELANLRVNARGPVSIIPFLQNLKGIEPYVQDDVLKDEIIRVEKYLASGLAVKEALEDYQRTASNEILYLYRMRNKIAHDGDTRHHMLEMLCSLAERYVNVLLGAIRIGVERMPNSSLDEVLIDSVQEYGSLLKSLGEKAANPYDLIFVNK